MDEKDFKPKHKISFILNEQEATSSMSSKPLIPRMQNSSNTESVNTPTHLQQLANPILNYTHPFQDANTNQMRPIPQHQTQFSPIRTRDNRETSGEHFFRPYPIRHPQQPTTLPPMNSNLSNFPPPVRPPTQNNFSSLQSNNIILANQLPNPMSTSIYHPNMNQQQSTSGFPSRNSPLHQMSLSSSAPQGMQISRTSPPSSSFVQYNSSNSPHRFAPQQQQMPSNNMPRLELPTMHATSHLPALTSYIQSSSTSYSHPPQMLPSMGDLFAKKEISQVATTSVKVSTTSTTPLHETIPFKRSTSVSPQEEEEEEDESTEGEYDSSATAEIEDINTINNKLLPIRILAHKLGLNKDPHKPWRYRDFKRALFEKLSKAHETFIESSPYHQLLKERLPHKLSMSSFCKRIMLLIFHFVIRDGKEPKFWSRKEVKQSLIESVLERYEGDFYRHINRNIAFRARALLQIHFSNSMQVDNYSLHSTEAISNCITNATRQYEMQVGANAQQTSSSASNSSQ